MADQSDGALLLAGFFVHVNGDTLGNIIRLTAAGRYDPGYAERRDSIYSPWRLHLSSDDMLTVGWRRDLFAGSFDSPVVYVARYTPDGRPDSTFTPTSLQKSQWANSSGYPTATDMAVEPDGRVYVSGLDLRTRADEYEGLHLYRFHPHGGVDSLYLPAVSTSREAYVHDIAIDSRGSTLAVHTSDDHIIGIDSSGSQRFSHRLYDSRNSYGLHYLSGDTLLALAESAGLLLFDGKGERVASSVPPPSYVRSSSLQGNRIVYVGHQRVDGRPLSQGIYRTDLTTGHDHSFRGELYSRGYVGNVVPLPDGRLIVSGKFTRVNKKPYHHLARLLPDGRTDTTFAPLDRFPDDALWGGVVRLSDGRLVVGGTVRKSNNRYGPVELLNANGRPFNRNLYWPDEDGPPTLGVGQLMVDSRDRVYAASSLLILRNRESYKTLLRYDFGAAGAVPPHIELSDSVRFGGQTFASLIPQEKDKLIVVPRVESTQSPFAQLRRITGDGQLDPTFRTAFPDNFRISALNTLPDHRLAVAGYLLPPSGRLDSADIALYLTDADGTPLEGVGEFTGETEYTHTQNVFITYYPGIFGILPIATDMILIHGRFSGYRGRSVSPPLLFDVLALDTIQNRIPPVKGGLQRSVFSPGGAVYLTGYFESHHGAIGLIRLGRDTVATSLTTPDLVRPLSLFPNPVRSDQPLTVGLVDRRLSPVNQVLQYRIVSLGGGAQVQSGKLSFTAGRAELLLNRLPTGVYQLIVRDGVRIWTQRLLYRGE